METDIKLLTQIEARVAKSFRNYLYAMQSGEEEQAASTYVELSSDVSQLFETRLETTDWDDGWLDGILFYSITTTQNQSVKMAGLFVWGDYDSKAFYLEPFQSRFELDESSDKLSSYLLCFRSRLKNRQYIEYTSSEARASRQLAIPQANDEIDESEWQYVFCKGLDTVKDA